VDVSSWNWPDSKNMSPLSKLSDPSEAAPSSVAGSYRTELVAGANRTGALAGLLGVVLYTVGVLVSGRAPGPDAATSEVVSFFVDHRSSLLAGFAFQLIALVFLLWFLGHLRTLVASAGGMGVPAASAMTAAWVMLMTTVALAMLPAMAIVWRGAASTSPDLVRLAYDMETLGTYAAAATAAIVSIAAPSLIIWRCRLLPGWLAILGALEVAANVLEVAGLSARHGMLAGGSAGGIGQVGWVLWVGAASVCMALRCRSRRATGQ
jgi:hypothetical protein